MELRATLHYSIKIFQTIGLLQIENNGTNTKFKVSKCRTNFSIFIILLFSIILPVQVLCNAIIYPSYLARHIAVLYWNIWSPSIVIVTTICYVYHRYDFCDVINKLFNCIILVENLRNKRMYTPMRAYCIVFIIFWILIVVMDHQYYKPLIFIEYIELLYTFSGITVFSVIILVISSMLKEFTRGFQSLLEEATNRSAISIQLKETYIISVADKTMGVRRAKLKYEIKDVVGHYKFIYYEIVEICHRLNEIFAMSTLAMVTHLTLITIVEGFNVYGVLFKVKDEHNVFYDVYLKFVSVPWAATGVFCLYMLIYPCIQVSNRSNLIKRLINSYISKCNGSNNIIHEMKDFALIHEKIVFSPKDMFTLNYSLILTIVGLSVSYLVILTQVAKDGS